MTDIPKISKVIRDNWQHGDPERLAYKLGVSVTTCWNWKSGKAVPREERLEPLAEALGVSRELLERARNRSVARRAHSND